ncbi:protein LEG1 homolog [Glandiceps talaboti]
MVSWLFKIAVCVGLCVASFGLYLNKYTTTGENANLTLEKEGVIATDKTLPPNWEFAPSSLTDYEIVNNTVMIDPWNYLHRLGLLKIMLNATNSVFVKVAGDDQANILWGLAIQFGWQYSTGRLKSHSDNNCNDIYCVSYNSWWASMNYYLTVIPFLGAVEAEVVNLHGYRLHLEHAEQRSEQYCASISSCNDAYPDTMQKWEQCFLVLKNMTTALDKLGAESSKQVIIDGLLKFMWDAHISSIHAVIQGFAPLLKHYPVPERDFGTGWAHLVDFLASSRFATNFTSTTMFQQLCLPKRILQDGDKPPFIFDMSYEENLALYTINSFYTIDYYTGDALLSLWQRAMCSTETRELANELMSSVFLHPMMAIKNIFRILIEMTRNC